MRSNKQALATTSKVSACSCGGCECSGCDCCLDSGGILLLITLICLVVFLMLTGITRRSGGCGCCGEEGADEGWCSCELCSCDDDDKPSKRKSSSGKWTRGKTLNQRYLDNEIDEYGFEKYMKY